MLRITNDTATGVRCALTAIGLHGHPTSGSDSQRQYKRKIQPAAVAPSYFIQKNLVELSEPAARIARPILSEFFRCHGLERDRNEKGNQ